MRELRQPYLMSVFGSNQIRLFDLNETAVLQERRGHQRPIYPPPMAILFACE
jgi:hypothetical protein